MTPSDPNDPQGPADDPKRVGRMSLRRKVSLKFKEFQGFVNEYSENVSAGGMFIRTPSPQPPGAVFDFEFTLGEDYTLIHGIGEVVWVRDEDEGFDRPAGMGIRFLSLDPDSRKLIDRMVKERLERRGAVSPAAHPDRPWDEPLPAEPEPDLEWGEDPPEPPAEAPPLSWDDGPEDAPEREADRAPGPEPGPEPVPQPEAETGGTAAASLGPLAAAGSSPYAYARSYQGSGVARKSRRARPLLVVLLVIALLVAALAAFFLFFPETAVRLLVGGEGGEEDRLVEVRRPARGNGAPEGGRVEPVPRAEAGALLDSPPEPAAPEDETVGGEPGAGDERELGFFSPAPGATEPGAAEDLEGESAAEEAPLPPPPAPAPEPGAAEAGAPSDFSRVLNVVWEELGGEVLVTVHLDGTIAEWDYSTARIQAPPPRELVRIEGIERAFPRTSIPVGTDLLEGIRIGFHPEARRSQLHLVLDLATPEAELARTLVDGTELRLYVARRDG